MTDANAATSKAADAGVAETKKAETEKAVTGITTNAGKAAKSLPGQRNKNK